jgi:hypothetical protein
MPHRKWRAIWIGATLLACVFFGSTLALGILPLLFLVRVLVPLPLLLAFLAMGFALPCVVLFRARHLLPERRKRWLRSPWFLALVCPWLAWWAVSLVLTARLSPEGADDPVLFLDSMFMGAGFLGAIACVALFVGLRGTSPEKPLGALVLIPILLLPVPLMLFVWPKVAWLTRRAAFEDMTHRAQPLIAAIEGFAADHGGPPPDLAALVPAYLDQLPTTGLRAYPEFGYWTSAEGWGFEIDCSRGLGNFDRFYYPPDPGRVFHPDDIELINGWAYYHE